MPRIDGLALAQLRQKIPGVKFVFRTVNEDPDIAEQAINLGASGYLLKSSAANCSPCDNAKCMEW
jgi:DNA-binding NarL/FixJ family response regulator